MQIREDKVWWNDFSVLSRYRKNDNLQTVKGMPYFGVQIDIIQSHTYGMSTIQIRKDWQEFPAKRLVRNVLVEECRRRVTSEVKCVVCSSVKMPHIFDENGNPLVLRCMKCGHKSWAIS